MNLVSPTPWPVVSVDAAHELLTAPGARFEMERVLVEGREVRSWKNAPPTLRHIFEAARGFGDREFVVYEGERATYDGFVRAVSVLAARLTADGVVKGDRVAVIMRNLPEWPVAVFAAACVGAIVTPLNAWWTAQELAYGLIDSGAKIAIVDGERLERLEGHLTEFPDLKLYVARAGEVGGAERLEAVIGRVDDWSQLRSQPLPEVDLAPDDPATIFYTSGTTGKPKGALGTHRNVTAAVMASGFAAARNFLRRGDPLPESDPHKAPQRVTLLVVPMFHVTGFGATLCPLINSGGKLVLMHRFDAETALGLIEQERVTATGGVPTIAWQLLEHPRRGEFDLSSLQQLTYGGAPSAPELVRRMAATWPGAAPGNGWGMTETSATFSSHLGRDYEARPESCGPAAPTGDIEIRDAAGAVVPAGVIGELWVRGPGVVQSYWNKPEASAETFVAGWLRTGDLARLDDEGFCYIVDRAKDMLIRGGENIYCVEVENVLFEHPDVLDAAVVGVPHRTLGEEPAAVVQLRAGAAQDEGALQAWVRARLAAFKIPVRVAFSEEALPRNVNGKLMKAELRETFL